MLITDMDQFGEEKLRSSSPDIDHHEHLKKINMNMSLADYDYDGDMIR